MRGLGHSVVVGVKQGANGNSHRYALELAGREDSTASDSRIMDVVYYAPEFSRYHEIVTKVFDMNFKRVV
jgi:hypothetical protein